MRPSLLMLCIPAIVCATPPKKTASSSALTLEQITAPPEALLRKQSQSGVVYTLPIPPFSLTEKLEVSMMNSLHALPIDLQLLLRDEYREVYKDKHALYLWLRDVLHPCCVHQVPRSTRDAYSDLQETRNWSARCEALMTAINEWN